MIIDVSGYRHNFMISMHNHFSCFKQCSKIINVWRCPCLIARCRQLGIIDKEMVRGDSSTVCKFLQNSWWKFRKGYCIPENTILWYFELFCGIYNSVAVKIFKYLVQITSYKYVLPHFLAICHLLTVVNQTAYHILYLWWWA